MEKYIIPKGAVVVIDDEIICWDKVLHIYPTENDKSKTKIVFENGHWVISDKDVNFFKKELAGISKEL
jgi:hypothetical protein